MAGPRRWGCVRRGVPAAIALGLAACGTSTSPPAASVPVRAPSSGATAAPPTPPPPARPKVAPRGLVAIRLSRREGTIPLVSVVIGGHRVRMVLDTGAGRTVLDTGALARLGLRARGAPIGAHAAGCSPVARAVRIPRWSLGGRRLPAVTGLATPVRIATALGAVGLLGGDVFRHAGGLTLDYRARTLRLGRPVGERGRRLRARVVRAGADTLVTVRVRVHDAPPAVFVLDTGAAGTTVSPALVDAARLPDDGPAQTIAGVGCRSRVPEVRLARARSGAVRFPATRALVQDAPVTGAGGLLGEDVLKRFGHVAIDERAGTVRVG